MPQVNPFKLTRTSRVGKRIADDMPRRNDLLFHKEIVTSVSKSLNPMSMFNFFSNLGGRMLGTEEQGKQFDIMHRAVGAEYIRSRKYREHMVPARVVDASRVPDVLIAGHNFELTQDKFIGEAGEKVMLKDMVTQLMVTSYRPSADGRNFDYTYQLIDQPEKSTISGSIISIDSPINYGFGNSVGEGSLTGNTLVDDDERYTDRLNVLPVLRYVIPRTGNAMADETFKFTGTEAMDGSEEREVEYVTDLPLRGAKKVLAAIDHDLLFSRANFDIKTRRIANRANTTRYPERPSYAGLFQQWDQAPYIWQAYQKAPLSEGVKLLQDILSFKRNELGSGKRYIAYCMGMGRQYLKAVFGEAIKQIGYNIQIEVDENNKLGKGTFGFDFDEYVTPDGSITIMDIGYALNQWGAEFTMINYNNVGYSPRSNRIYLQPIAVGQGMDRKLPATIYHKEGNGISRGFVLGTTRGITGANGGMTGQALAAMQEDGLRRMLDNERYNLSSTADMDEMHILSQICPDMDTDMMSVIEIV
ncbi:hypothetical protein [Spirosoma sordidisoli]|uniref:Uncharacterized protein n=1 Tax=Spirosoma sordidisoli TaxID=2502893 RepID=A0A4Q2UM34_9BACT|nr:hypothetical protein [Spirosoma sordidisoli]RYC70667.1 hypothetical protein EQG79_00515 [Spirosoma sordidisoli]